MSDRISFRLPPEGQRNLDAFIKATGKKASEIARAGLEIYMAQCGWRIGQNVGQVSDVCQTNESYQNVPPVGQVSDNPHVRTRSRALDLSKDKSSSTQKEIDNWFRLFWVKCELKVYPERIKKSIKERWSDLSDQDPSEVADKYNSYCSSQTSNNREKPHPNSWLSGGGYLNEEEQEDSGGLAYDYD